MKEPSLFKKFITVVYEQAKRRRALRILEKQSWSFDFLALLLMRASKLSGEGLNMVITNKDGLAITLTHDSVKKSGVSDTLDPEDSIFNHLDDELAIQDFIRTHSVR